MSLLNAYLSAKYGNGSYVDQYSNRHIYLDKNIIEEKGLDYVKITEESRDFLVKMSGVAEAYTAMDLMSPATSQLEIQRLATDPKTSGDIILEFNPGWTVVDDSRYPPQQQKSNTSVYNTPGFILGPGVVHKVVEEPVEAVAIAPTLATALRIRAPNSAASKPLQIK